MLAEAFFHGTKNNWAYAYNCETIHLRFRTKRNDVERVYAVTGDKYDWQRTHQTVPMEKAASDDLFDYWECAVRPQYKRICYCFRLESGDETLWMNENGISSEQPVPADGYYDFPYIHAVDVFTPPKWAKDAVFYQIFPDRFASGDPANNPEDVIPWGSPPDYYKPYGGDLLGVMNHLDYLCDLGINAIYFTPIFESPTYHKYDISDYKKVDPRLGDNELLKRLVEQCHKRGIRVMLDAVFNHCGEQFPPFKDVLEKGEKSRYADWFHVREFPLAVKDGIPTYDTFGFFGQMPKFNTANPEVMEFLLDVAEYWIREIDIDGWRLDVASEIDHHFWRDFRRVVKRAKEDAYIVGEVWNDSVVWLLGDQFDSVMNYPFSGKVMQFFSQPDVDGYSFANSMGRLLMRYPQQANEVIFNMLCSHDTARALTMCGEDKRKLKLAVVFLLTYIGTPCIFYGDEIGLKGDGDPDCRRSMEWDPEKRDNELLDFYKMMIRLRKENKALREGRFRFLHAEPGDRRILYERMDEDTHFLIWMNNSDQPTTFSHDIQTTDWKDALTGEHVQTKDGAMSFDLAPYDYRIVFRNLR